MMAIGLVADEQSRECCASSSAFAALLTRWLSDDRRVGMEMGAVMEDTDRLCADGDCPDEVCGRRTSSTCCWRRRSGRPMAMLTLCRFSWPRGCSGSRSIQLVETASAGDSGLRDRPEEHRPDLIEVAAVVTDCFRHRIEGGAISMDDRLLLSSDTEEPSSSSFTTTICSRVFTTVRDECRRLLVGEPPGCEASSR